MLETTDYLRFLERWLPLGKQFVKPFPARLDLMTAGAGTSDASALSAQVAAFLVFSELAVNSRTDLARTGVSRDDLWWYAFKTLRYLLFSHQSGPGSCLDGRKWGHDWETCSLLPQLISGMQNMEIYLSNQDQEGLCQVLTSECDWLMSQQPQASWQLLCRGSVLWQTAQLYPDYSQAEQWEAQGLEELTRGLTLPDAWWRILEQRRLPAGIRIPSTGPVPVSRTKITQDLWLMLETLAHLHFSSQQQGWDEPDSWRQSLEDCFQLARLQVCPDGTRLQVGDERAMDFSLTAWLLMRDCLGHAEVSRWEENWLKRVGMVQALSGNGSLTGTEHDDPETEHRELLQAAMIAWGATCHRTARDFQEVPKEEAGEKFTETWDGAFDDALLTRGNHRLAMWNWWGPKGPEGRCMPSWRSDMATAGANLAGRIVSPELSDLTIDPKQREVLNGGFLTSGLVIATHEKKPAVRSVLACAALPDGQTVLVLQRARTLQPVTLTESEGLALKVPNDALNGGLRHVETAEHKPQAIRGKEGCGQLIQCGAWLNLDGCLAIRSLNGDSLTSMGRKEDGGYVNAIVVNPQQDCALGLDQKLYDVSVALRMGIDGQETARWATENLAYQIRADRLEELLIAAVKGTDDKGYVLVCNAGTETNRVEVDGQQASLAPGESQLFVLA